jgi:hypothetical protein
LQFLDLRAESAADAAIIALNGLDRLSGEYQHPIVIGFFHLGDDLAETGLKCLTLRGVGLHGMAGNGLKNQPGKARMRFGAVSVQSEKFF